MQPLCSIYVFFFNDTATTEIYTLSLHDALPISAISFRRKRPRQRLSHHSLRRRRHRILRLGRYASANVPTLDRASRLQIPKDRKSTRLNSSHSQISYAVFCLKKKSITTCAPLCY